MKALITGSKGFIGSHLKKVLKANNYEFFEFDLPEKDVTNSKDFKNLPACDVVFHLAAFASIPKSFEFPEKAFDVNYNGTKNILEYCKKNNSHLIFTSTYPYGSPDYLPIDEYHPLNPDSPYKESKIKAEALCAEYSENFNVKVSVLRLFNVYGPNQSNEFVIPKIISQLKNKKIELFDPRPKRDFIYVSDVTSSFMAAIKNQKSKFEIFNIGTGKSHSINEVVDLLLNITNNHPEVIFLNKHRPNEVLDCYAEISKAKKNLNWEPKINLKEGLRLTLQNA